jgi:hypothetical protein
MAALGGAAAGARLVPLGPMSVRGKAGGIELFALERGTAPSAPLQVTEATV